MKYSARYVNSVVKGRSQRTTAVNLPNTDITIRCRHAIQKRDSSQRILQRDLALRKIIPSRGQDAEARIASG